MGFEPATDILRVTRASYCATLSFRNTTSSLLTAATNNISIIMVEIDIEFVLCDSYRRTDCTCKTRLKLFFKNILKLGLQLFQTSRKY